MARSRLASPSPPSVERRRRIGPPAGILGLFLLLVPPSWAQEGAGPESVFGALPAEQRISVPLLVHDEYRGEIELSVLAEHGEIRLAAEPLLQAISAAAAPDLISEIVFLADEEGWISLSNLLRTGLKAELDRRTLDFRVTVPAEERRTRNLDLRESRSDPEGLRILPSRFSAFLNFDLDLDQAYTPAQTSFNIAGDGALRLADWVLEGAFEYNSATAWDLEYARVVRDFPGSLYRLELGNLSFSERGLEAAQTLTGLYVYKNYRHPDCRRPCSGLTREIFLGQTSRVEVLINGILKRRLTLPPGPYLLQDFPFQNGINEVTIRVSGLDGEILEEVSFLVPYSGSLLPAGEISLGMAVGLPDGELVLPVVALQERWGAGERVCFGAVQAVDIDKAQLFFGTDTLWASRLGTFGLELSYEHWLQRLSAVSGSLVYQLQSTGKRAGSLTLATRYRDISVFSDGEEEWTSGRTWSLSAGCGWSLPQGFSLSPALSYRLATAEAPARADMSVGLRKALGANSSFNFHLALTVEGDAEPAWQAVISFGSALRPARQTIFIQQDMLAEKLYMNWSRYPENSVGGLSLFSSLSLPRDVEDQTIAAFNADYSGYRFLTSALHTYSSTMAGPEAGTNHSKLDFETALCFADGQLALTRPVRDNFLIVAPRDGTRGTRLEVNPSAGNPAARAGLLPAVLPDVASYRPRQIRVEAAELPRGAELEEDTFVFFPAYKSGALVRVGSATSICAGGVLREGRALLPLELGSFTALDDPAFGPREFFTDEKGRFELYGILPGRYRLTLYAFPDYGAAVEVPADCEGYLDLGSLVLTESGGP